jgi:arylsulfatase A-like enzyme
MKLVRPYCLVSVLFAGVMVSVFCATFARAASDVNIASADKKSDRPNIILIMADDMGFSDIGCYGSEIKTPNIDKLATNGIRFTQFYNGARCCPSRASLLTGLYAHQAGMGCMEPDWKHPGYRGNINKQCVTLAESLKTNGYATYMAGKWHLTNKTRNVKREDKFNWPCQRGFDRFYGTIAGAGNFYKPATLTRQNENIEQEAKDNPDFYYTDAISDNATTFINDHSKKKENPFFLYVAYTAPHWPLHAKEKDISKYRGRYNVGWDVIRKERHERMIKMGIIDKKWKLPPRDQRVAAWDDLKKSDWENLEKGKATEFIKDADHFRELMAEKMATYAAMIDCMDQGVGRIINALKDTGQMDNTLIVFLSDNGGCDEWGTYGFGWGNFAKTKKIAGSKESSTSYGPAWAHVSNTPFRYYKLYTHEGGTSTPLVVHWPKGVKKNKGGFCRQLSHIIDIMPTFMDAAKGIYPTEYEGNKIQPMEGISLIPSFNGDTIMRKPIFWEHIGNHAVVWGDWKLVARGEKGPWELYNLVDDRTEMYNLADKMPDKVKELNDAWLAWAKRCNVLPMNPNKKRK